MKRTISTMPPRKVSRIIPGPSQSSCYVVGYEDIQTQNFWNFACELLTGEPNEIGCGNDSNVIEGKSPEMKLCARVMRVDEVDGNGSWHKWPQEIHKHGRMAAGTKTYPEKVDWMEPASATLSIWLDAFCDFMSIVVVSGQVGQVWHMDHMVMMFLVLGLFVWAFWRSLVSFGRVVGGLSDAHVILLYILILWCCYFSLSP